MMAGEGGQGQPRLARPAPNAARADAMAVPVQPPIGARGEAYRGVSYHIQGGQIVCNRITGPGRVGLPSMYLHLPTAT